jgi:atypical dual specificity phosphatase
MPPGPSPDAPASAAASLPPILSLEGCGVAFGDRVVLAEVTLQVPARGTTVLMGPAGGGKSTTLRALAGLNQAQPDLRQWGKARYDGKPLGEGGRPVLVQQDVRYFTSTVQENLVSALPDRRRLDRGAQSQRLAELLASCGAEELAGHLEEEAIGLPMVLRRLLSVIRAVASEAPLICLDESTAGLEDDAAERILAVIRGYARAHAVLFVTHHQGHARAVADRVALLAGGRIQQEMSAEDFFTSDGTTLAGHFLDSGGFRLPSPDARPEEVSEGEAPPPLPAQALGGGAPNWFVGPRDFRWMIQGRLGGLPRPGIVASLAHDLDGLRRLGITTLVTLEETETVPPGELAAAGISCLHFPIVDMEAPQLAIAADWCREIASRLEAGEVIAMHCRAGQGRTGTMLASQLIWQGSTAIDALDAVRAVNPRWVTSCEQVGFLSRFYEWVRRGASAAT